MIKYLCFKFSRFVSVTFVIFLSIATTYASNDLIQEICPGVYSSKGVTKVGEPFYFGIELIDQSNLENWRRYNRHIGYMVNRYRGVLSNMAKCSAPENRSKNNEEDTGFTDHEFETYSDRLFTLGFKKGSDKLTTLENVESAKIAFELNESSETEKYYVAYLSKKPIIGKFLFSHLDDKITLKKFLTVYDDLVISIRVTFKPQNIHYETRGITKNPKSIVDENYRGISPVLFGYIGHVATKIFPNIKFMHTRPIPAMHRILCSTFSPQEMYVDDGTCGFPPATIVIDKNGKEEIIETFKSSEFIAREVLPSHPEFCFDRPHYIKIEAVKRLVAFNKASP